MPEQLIEHEEDLQGAELQRQIAHRQELDRPGHAGEKAGKVEDMLDSVADSYDEEVEALLNTLTSLIEPFLMVFLGVIIGTLCSIFIASPVAYLADARRRKAAAAKIENATKTRK